LKLKFIISYLLLLFVISPSQLNAQGGFSAYTDFVNKFYAFENGSKTQLEYLQPKDYKIGRSGIAYLDNLGIFKVFRNGINNKINNYFTSDFGVTDNLIYYKTQTSLHIIDNDEDQELCRSVGAYAVGDSVAMYYDKVKNILYAYYNNKKTELETNLATETFSDFKVSDNIIAYENFMSQFKIFQSGNTTIAESQPVKSFKIGRNTVAYVDYNNQFKIYYNGEVKTIDAFAPKSYLVGDNVVAYVGYDGYFKIIYNGEILPQGFYEKKYTVTDNIVAFEDGANYFKVFYKGETFNVDNYYPSKFISGYNSMAYINKSNMLILLSQGETKEVSSMVSNIDDVNLNYDVLQYKIGNNLFKFWSNGTEY
jgi:hypothetical protein